MTVHATIEHVHEPSARSDAAYATAVDPSSVASGPAAREWRPAPGELVSLWDMLCFHAFYFVRLFGFIQQWKQRFEMGATWLKSLKAGEDEVKVFDDTRDGLGIILDLLKGECEKLDLPISMLKIERIKGLLSSIKGNEIVNQFGHLEELITDELGSKLFLLIPTERVKYCPERVDSRAAKLPLFGEAVQNKFPELTADIIDAGWCLGTERSTAAVYHLMCIVEFGIRRMARRLKINRRLIEHKTWGQIFQVVNGKIAALPYNTAREKSRRDKYTEAMVHLNNVKDAWRNPTMHSKRRYAQEEAEAVFETVKTFTNYLATKRF